MKCSFSFVYIRENNAESIIQFLFTQRTVIDWFKYKNEKWDTIVFMLIAV